MPSDKERGPGGQERGHWSRPHDPSRAWEALRDAAGTFIAIGVLSTIALALAGPKSTPEGTHFLIVWTLTSLALGCAFLFGAVCALHSKATRRE